MDPDCLFGLANPKTVSFGTFPYADTTIDQLKADTNLVYINYRKLYSPFLLFGSTVFYFKLKLLLFTVE